MWHLQVHIEMSSPDSANFCGNSESFEGSSPQEVYEAVMRWSLDPTYYAFEGCPEEVLLCRVETAGQLEDALNALFWYVHKYMYKGHREYYDIMYEVTNAQQQFKGRIAPTPALDL